MPSYKAHIAGGCFAFALAHALITVSPWYAPWPYMHYPLMLGITLSGALFPDIDVYSKMQQAFFKALLVCLPFALFYNQALFALLAVGACGLLFLPHRGITHALWFLISLPTLISFLLVTKHPAHKSIIFAGCIFFIAGSVSHIVMDYVNSKLFAKKQ
jgi:membrane-bound metal-dependent hydrolase YbcI (DUF457 family)